jgi:hypothetical protein
MVPRTATTIPEDAVMEPMSTELTSDLEFELGMHDDELLVREWRVEQLRRLGVSRRLADRFADFVDWHDLAKLVAVGCPPEVALDIIR